jgi:NAD(P)H-hydrate epimerase
MAMISPKVGLYREPGSRFAGEVRLAGLGLPRHLLEDGGFETNLITPDLVKGWLPVRPSDAHKGLLATWWSWAVPRG